MTPTIMQQIPQHTPHIHSTVLSAQSHSAEQSHCCTAREERKLIQPQIWEAGDEAINDPTSAGISASGSDQVGMSERQVGCVPTDPLHSTWTPGFLPRRACPDTRPRVGSGWWGPVGRRGFQDPKVAGSPCSSYSLQVAPPGRFFFFLMSNILECGWSDYYEYHYVKEIGFHWMKMVERLKNGDGNENLVQISP